MTINILQNQASFTFTVNVPSIAVNCNLEIFSPYSNTVLVDFTGTLNISNTRYSQFTVTVPTDFWDNHYNGMYTYRLYEGTTTYDEGSFKLITKPGGDMGTIEHISNNENREAQVVFRSNY